MEPDATRTGERAEGLRLGRIIGIPIYVNISWFVVFSVVLWSLATGYFPTMYPEWAVPAHWVLALATAVLFFASVLLHELSHSVVAVRNGLPITSISLYVFGGVARMSEEPRRASVEAAVAVAGPVASLALALLFIGLSLLPVGAFAGAVAGYLGLVNLLLAGFNMLPGFPLDGGRLLRAILWGRWGDLRRATKVASRSGQVLAYLLMGVGAASLLLGGMLMGLWWLMIGWFLDSAARSGYQHVLVREALEGIRVGELMETTVVSVDQDMTVAEFIDRYLFRHQQRTFPVMESGVLSGLIALDDVRKVAVDERTRVRVGDIMTPRDRLCLASASDSAYDALRCMVNHDVGRLPVMSGGAVVGLVSRDQLLRVVALRSG